MKSKDRIPSKKIVFCLVPIIIGFLYHQLMLLIEVFCFEEGEGIFRIFKIFLESQFAEGDNFFLICLLGLIPFIVLTLRLFSQTGTSFRKLKFMCLMGILGILILMIPVHFSIIYGIYHSLPGASTSVIAYFTIPFFSLIPMFISLAIGDTLFGRFKRGRKNE